MNATLSNLVANDHGLRVFCNTCGRCVDLDVDELVTRHGSAMELPEIGRRQRAFNRRASRLPLSPLQQ